MGNTRRIKKDLMKAKGMDTSRQVKHTNKSGKVSYYDVSTIREHKLLTVTDPKLLKDKKHGI